MQMTRPFLFLVHLKMKFMRKHKCANQFHINVDKSCIIHFRHEYSNVERLKYARTDKTDDKLLTLKHFFNPKTMY